MKHLRSMWLGCLVVGLASALVPTSVPAQVKEGGFTYTECSSQGLCTEWYCDERGCVVIRTFFRRPPVLV